MLQTTRNIWEKCFHQATAIKTALLILGIAASIYVALFLITNKKSLVIKGPPEYTGIKEKINNDRSLSNSAAPEFCRKTSNWTKHVLYSRFQTKFKDWTFTSRRKCPSLDIVPPTKIRPKLTLSCDEKRPRMLKLSTTLPRDIEMVPFGNKCLQRFIDHCCKDKLAVPNVVHYVWYAKKELQFFHFLSFVSAIRFLKPCLILLHGDFVPYGKYWDFFINTSPNVVHVKRHKPTHVFGNRFAFPEHGSDVMRIEALREYGGIYLDTDEIVLRPLERLRRYNYTQGHETNHTNGSQLIMAKKNATFLTLWHNSYRDNYSKKWQYNALYVPNEIAKRYPNLVHVEGFRFTSPNWRNVKQIFKENYNWTNNLAMHLYKRWYKNFTDERVIRTLNTTIGSVSRHVLFGNKELCYK